MADTLGSVVSLVQFIADDRDAQFLDAATQVVAINAGYREFQRRMAIKGSPILKNSVVLAIPAVTCTQIDLAGSQGATLPADFNIPYRLWEKQTGITDYFDSHPMVERADTLPDRIQDTYLRDWRFENNVIKLVGATSANSVRMLYANYLAALVNTSSVIPVPFALDAIAWATLYQVALARGATEDYRQQCSQMVEFQLEQLAGLHIKREQRIRRRRMPHSAGKF
jgi:hypothetical protein